MITLRPSEAHSLRSPIDPDSLGFNQGFDHAEHSEFAVKPSPIVLDLDGDSVETTTAATGVYFDLEADGFVQKIGWVAPDDGLLAHDLNGNGVIDNGGELSSLPEAGVRSISTAYHDYGTSASLGTATSFASGAALSIPQGNRATRSTCGLAAARRRMWSIPAG